MATAELVTGDRDLSSGGRDRRRWWLLIPAAVTGGLVVLLNGWNQYTSDSVAQQSLVRTWLDAGHGTAYVPGDTWILKLPLYAVVEAFPLPPALRLLLEVVVLNAVSMLLLTLTAWWLTRAAFPQRPSVAGLVTPLVWLGTLGGELGSNRMQPNYRNIELGLSFLALAVAARYLDRPDHVSHRNSRRTWGFASAASVLLALLWVDDPYFAFLTGLPFGVLCSAWLLLRRRWDLRLLVTGGTVLASLLLTFVLAAALRTAGLQVVPGSSSTQFGLAELKRHLSLLIPAAAAQLGLADTHPHQPSAHRARRWRGDSRFPPAFHSRRAR